ncbi:MAG: hypothetical protein ACI38Q_09270, partial [Candidatus Bruticola sp.]
REEAKQNICLTQLIKYRGTHGNLRLWRVYKSSLIFGANGAVLNEAGSSRLYRGSTFTCTDSLEGMSSYY